MKMAGAFILLIMSMTFSVVLCASEGPYRFAVVPKTENSSFFQQVRDGCMAASQEIAAVECTFQGPQSVDVRKQDQIISRVIDEGVSGIAVAVMRGEFVARNSMQKALKAGIPVITFDADFDAKILNQFSGIRLAYIGTDNFQMGLALGAEVKRLRPAGGVVCIQSGRPDSHSLNLRIMGLRSALSGLQYKDPPGVRLNSHGWREADRCPLYNFEQADRSRRQIGYAFTRSPDELDTFVAVGGWAQLNDKRYRNIAETYRHKLDEQDLVVVMGDTLPVQLNQLRDGLSNANIGQNPYEMGRQAIYTLHKIVTGQHFESVIHTPLIRCVADSHQDCTVILR